MGATNALPNLKFRPCAASAGGGRGGGGGLPSGGLRGAGEWECEFVQRAPTYGTEGNLATHIVSVKVVDTLTARMPMLLSVEPVCRSCVANVLLLCCSCVANVLLMCCSCVAHVLH